MSDRKDSAGTVRHGVGVSAGRVDGRAKCRGDAEYLDDLTPPGLLHATVVRSTVAHARITAIVSQEALNIPGVVAVLTAADLATRKRYGHSLADQPVLADQRVLYVGQPVAIVVGTDRNVTGRAARLVDVEYDNEPVVGLDNALTGRAPLLHEETVSRGFLWTPLVGSRVDGNVCYEYSNRVGDAERLIDTADHVVERDYTFPSAYQYAMEPHGAIAAWDGAAFEIWASCQHPFLVRADISRLFELDLERVRIHVPFVGGGFGSKSYTTVEPLACAAARAVGRPVKVVNTPEESMQTTRQHNMQCTMLTAMSADGRLLVRRARILMDAGAFATNSPTVAFMTGVAAPGPYSWEAVDVTTKAVYTNRPPAGSYRGFGGSHTQWISEQQIDELAHSAGLDRFELRRQNLLRRGALVHPEMKPLDADLAASYEKALAGLSDLPLAGAGERIGTGVGFGLIAAGADPTSTAVVRLRSDGRVTVLVGTTEIGQGARTIFSQIVAEHLGIPLADIAITGTDTSVTPFDRSTGASRSTTVTGLAVERAAQDVVSQLASAAGRLLGTDSSEVSGDRGAFAAASGASVSVSDVVASLGANGQEIVGRGRTGDSDENGQFPVYWEVCVGAAVVSVDEESGWPRILRTVGVADVGTAINPQLVGIQDAGCTVQALGQTLFEELAFADDGQLLTPSLVQYHVPTTVDAPQEMHCWTVENGDGPGPFGAKGCGEGPFGAIPAAIATGIAAAVGAPMTALPLTPERIWLGLQSAAKAGGTKDAAR